MEQNLAKNYDPKDFEERIYKTWEETGSFIAERDRDKKPYTIVMPPPNITGQLHMGHALDHTLQDVLIRYKRMHGFSALWLPGSDHASIATEVKVVEKLRKEEGLTKEDLGREEFLKRAWAWKKEYGGRITKQCRKLGDSCDWSRERFTMDEGCNKAVRHFFVQLYKKGLIYRGNRLINWCPDCGTSLSDAEVEHRDIEGLYWYFRYPAAEEGGKDMVVATSRPETMFGDTAIAVNPEDERYKDMVGTKVILPLVGREIPIIADPYPDPEKGTGAVKITPAHDPNDFEVGQRAGLEILCCMNDDATMNELAGKYAGMDRYECRKAWVKELEDAGYLVKTEKVTIPVGECYRCHNAIEPMLSDQWFVAMEELAKPAIEAAKSGELSFVPDRFEKIYLKWLNEIRDWCISRQLWWGHRIPAWYCQDCGAITVAEETPCACEKCGSANIKQDEDVLDTWFSSALWPFSTMGWPEETEDFKYFYPTDVLVTGYDIIFFWVVRMVFSACETTGKSPFHHVYVHGLVRDALGRKMSKSLGNGVDPLEIIDKYGADALRFMLSTGITPGNDMRFTEDRIESARNFANKLWNASRFVIMNLVNEDGSLKPIAPGSVTELAGRLSDEDKWMMSRVKEAQAYAEKAMDKYELAMAGQRVYDLIWSEFCDWYIEMVKKRLQGTGDDVAVCRRVLLTALKDMLKMLHPFMPFITEEIWGKLPESDGLLIGAQWPCYDELPDFEEEAARVETAMEIIKAIRVIRTDAGAAPGKKLNAMIVSGEDEAARIRLAERFITEIGGITHIEYMADKSGVPEDAMGQVITGAEVFVPLAELVDIAAEIERLAKEKARLEGEVKRASGKLANEGFVSKAPARLIEEERAKLADYTEKLGKVTERLAAMQGK
ncbi:MAG: valine--tRNA ligase [Clostridia bacterium]|nr:valine--tRNA ligase [Clostridia bacterium]